VSGKLQQVFYDGTVAGANWIMLKNHVDGYYSIMGADNISGPWFNVSNPTQDFRDMPVGAGAITIKPTLAFKDENGIFVMWGYSCNSSSSSNKMWWWWSTSSDLQTWSYVGHEYLGKQTNVGQYRMPNFESYEEFVGAPYDVMTWQWQIYDPGLASSVMMFRFDRYPWYDFNLPYRVPITINHTLVEEDLTDFPVVITNISQGCRDAFWSNVYYN
jgi:hypothetical protein